MPARPWTGSTGTACCGARARRCRPGRRCAGPGHPPRWRAWTSPSKTIPEVTDPVVQGALRVSAELGRLGPTWRTAPRQVLARLHTLAAAGLTEDLGRPRTGIEAPDLLGLGDAPGPEETVARVDGLVELVTGSAGGSSKAPALVLAAIVHAELAVLRPFGSADGVVARAAERLTLVEFGLDPKSLAAVEVGHLELGTAYAESLRPT